MSKINNFSHSCQYKNSNPAVIIIPSVLYTNQILITHGLAAKHALVLCYSLLDCWRNQSSWLGEERPKLDSMLARPLKAKMVELNYKRLRKALSLTKDQLKTILVDLEQAKLIRRVLIRNKWYILLLDEAFKMYLNNNNSKKRRINKGNVICTSWLGLLKTDGGQPDFTGALILGEIAYFSRVLKRKQPADDYDAAELNEPAREVTADHNSCAEENRDLSSINDREDHTKLVSKSKGLVAYFEYDHFKKKLPFIDNQTINRTLSRLEKNNVIAIERIRFMQNRRVVKRMYITLNYELIQKGVEKTVIDFIFKTDDYLNREQLTSFYQNTPSFIYSKYNNKTIIYPVRGFVNNFSSFSSILSSSCLTTYYPTEPREQIISKKWYQVTCLNNDNIDDDGHEGNGKDAAKRKPNKYKQRSQESSTESHWSKKKAFRIPRYLSEMQSSLMRHYRAYFACFDYPLPFCYQLLESLAKKYPDAAFRGDNQFISYFRKILAQEKRAAWLVKNRKYFKKALGLADLAYDKLPNGLREKLNKLATGAGKPIAELSELLSKLAARNTKHLFSCFSSFLSYMKQILCKLKSKEEIQEAYKALPRINISEVASYLNRVEASYARVGPEEHLRRKLASTLPMTVAYHLLSSCNFYSTRMDGDKNFIIPSKNKNWAEMIRGGIKDIIKDQIMAVYGQIKAIKFVQVLRKEEAAPKPTSFIGEDALSQNTTVAWAIKTVAQSINAQSSSSISNSKEHQSKSIQNEPTSYNLFQQKRLKEEQRKKEELAALLREEEQELREQGNVNPGVYERYKQVVAEAELERIVYIKQGGDRDKARELYKALSFSKWMQLQELLGMA